MNIVEIIGMQQIRIHTLEEQVGKLGAANQAMSQELFKYAPEKFPNGNPAGGAPIGQVPLTPEQVEANRIRCEAGGPLPEPLPAGDAV
jgi:hypothetical protein